MTKRRTLIGRGLGLAALAAMILAGACGQADSDGQTKSDASSDATVVKTASQASAGTSEREPAAGPAARAARESAAPEQRPAQPPQEEELEGPRLRLEKDGHDFGKIHDTNPQVYDLEITNIGNRPLTIHRISTSCGCTSTNKSEIEGTPIPPGESRFIEIKYKPKATAQKVTKTVTFQSDDYVEPVQRFKVSAQLIEPARLEPPRYQMGQIRSGEGHKTSFYVLSPDPNVEILSIESQNFEYAEFDVVDDPDDDPNFPGRKRVDVSIAENIPTGSVRASFLIKTKAAAEPGEEPVEQTLSGMILGHVRGELLNNPRFLRIRNVGPGEAFEERTMLYSEHAREFKITGTRIIDSTLDDVTVETVPLEPFENDEPGYWIIVKGTLAGDARGAFQGKVLVSTDIPNESEKAIIFNGIVRRSLPR